MKDESPVVRDIPLTPDKEIERDILSHIEANFCIPEKRHQFRNTQPFPYIVLDQFLPNSVCEYLEDKGRKIESFQDNVHLNSKKKAEHRYWMLDKNLRDCLSIFYSEKFLALLEELTGINGLISDADYNWGGGFHILPAGGFLNIHKDFNIHPYTGLHRRLNLLIYLNKGWKDEDGGQLEFWDMKNKKMVESIVPVFNRAGLFETSEISYHGNPNKVTRSDGYERMAYNLYYYTKDRPESDNINEHTTVYVDRPGQYTNRIRNFVTAVTPNRARRFILDSIRRFSDK